ncbi:MAG TPA: cytochrome c oxidase subunit 2A [Chloroflexi bacterium]|nr:cytochrome c oxidase subunit 2A [Chloroflexota bacterium]
MPKKQPEEPFEPKGTIVVMAIFVVTLIVLWGSVYYILISRGVTL